jgi:hypothetical protein
VRRLAAALLVASALAISGCSSGGDGKPTAKSSAPSRAPQEVLATPSGGSAGVGPIVATDPHQQVGLPDRTIMVKSSVRQPGGRASSAAIVVNVDIGNPGATPIGTDVAAFQVIGPEGDVFGAKSVGTSSVGPHTSGSVPVSFEVPAVAAGNLRLLYRPGPDARTVMVPLIPG